MIPAAGHATRLQPLSGAKEMLEIGRRPIMDCLVERMRVGDCTRLRVVTRPEKDDVIAHAEKLGAAGSMSGRRRTLHSLLRRRHAEVIPDAL